MCKDTTYSETDLDTLHAAVEVLRTTREAQTKDCGCACHCLSCQALVALKRALNEDAAKQKSQAIFSEVSPSPLSVLDEHYQYHLEKARAATNPVEKDVLLRVAEKLRAARDAALT